MQETYQNKKVIKKIGITKEMSSLFDIYEEGIQHDPIAEQTITSPSPRKKSKERFIKDKVKIIAEFQRANKQKYVSQNEFAKEKDIGQKTFNNWLNNPQLLAMVDDLKSTKKNTEICYEDKVNHVRAFNAINVTGYVSQSEYAKRNNISQRTFHNWLSNANIKKALEVCQNHTCYYIRYIILLCLYILFDI